MLDPKQFRENAEPVVRWIDRYFRELENYPVKSGVKPGEIYGQIPGTPPEKAESLEAIISDLERVILPGMTHWQHPNFHAYFPANSSVESVLGEFVTAAMGAQCMIWETSPAAAELEQRMAEWLRDAMGLPSFFEGVIQDSASSASLTALITAREVATGFRSNREGISGRLRVYCSTETHSSIEKGMGISGMGRDNLVKVEVDERMAMKSDALEKSILADLEAGHIPCAVVAALGTTGTVAVDPLKEIAAISKKYDLWLHVDAAYAGSALLLPEYGYLGEGLEEADSFVFNAHKWLFTNFDCSLYFVKSVEKLIQSFEILPEYLKTGSRGLVNDYRDWGIPLGRRFRALKLWFVIRGFGLEGLRERLRSHIGLTEHFSRKILEIPGMELLTPPFLNFCTFRLVPEGMTGDDDLNDLNRELLGRLNARGRIFLTHTKIGGNYALRMITGQTYIEQDHVDRALEEIRQVSEDLLKGE